MVELDSRRPDPEALLKRLNSDEDRKKGRLKIFLGYAAGVGKTYSMLDDAHEKLSGGIDVLAGYVEPHTRPETMQLLEGLPILPPQEISYKNLSLQEFDLDAALDRNPELILVDELAHTNAPGMRNKKRYQDIEELLNAGIDVYTTVNIQHIESLNDIVQKITKIKVKETVPDFFFDNADTVELIDFSPEELLKRFEEGKIYRPERAETAMKKFFAKENLQLLRELTLRKAADRLSHDNESGGPAEKQVGSRLLVCVSSSASSEKLIRWTARTAEAFHASWAAVYVDTMAKDDETNIQANLDLAKRLGAETLRLNGLDIAATIAEYSKLSGITNIVIGKITSRNSVKDFFKTDLEDKLVSLLPDVEIHIIPSSPHKKYQKQNKIRLTETLYFSWFDAAKTAGVLVAATLLNMGLQAIRLGDQNLIMVYILSVLLISRTTSGHLYGMVSSVLSVLLFNFFFTVPYYTFNAIQPGYPITFVIMFLVAFITSTTTVHIRAQMRLSVEREHRIRILYEINKKLLVTRGLENIVTLTNEYLTKIFERSVIFYTEDPDDGVKSGAILEAPTDPDASFLNQESEKAVAHWVFQNQKRAGASTDTLMGAGAYYVPMISQSKVLGVVGVSCVKSKLDQNSRLFLRMLASLVALALERSSAAFGEDSDTEPAACDTIGSEPLKL